MKKKKKKNNIVLIILLGIFIISTLLLGTFIYYDKFIFHNNYIPNNSNNNYINKIYDSSNWVIKADYEKNVLANSYQTYYKTYYAKNIEVPFLNINSIYANNCNNGIREIFDEAIIKYNEGVNNHSTYVDLDYENFIGKDFISVILTYEYGGTDLANKSYFTYNIDLINGNMLSFEEIYQKVGFNKNNIDNKIKNAITEEIIDIFEEIHGDNINKYINESILNYIESLNNKQLQYFINDDNELCIIAKLNIPVGTGYINKVLEIE